MRERTSEVVGFLKVSAVEDSSSVRQKRISKEAT